MPQDLVYLRQRLAALRARQGLKPTTSIASRPQLQGAPPLGTKSTFGAPTSQLPSVPGTPNAPGANPSAPGRPASSGTGRISPSLGLPPPAPLHPGGQGVAFGFPQDMTPEQKIAAHRARMEVKAMRNANKDPLKDAYRTTRQGLKTQFSRANDPEGARRQEFWDAKRAALIDQRAKLQALGVAPPKGTGWNNAAALEAAYYRHLGQ